MVRSAWAVPVFGLLLFSVGCQDRGETPTAAPEPVAEATAPAGEAPPPPPMEPATVEPPAAAPASASGPDAWLGQWNGPEGTSLVLASKEGGGYRVTITSLDGPASYDGDAAGPGIVFERDGETQTIRAGNGKLTGMKWLAEKSDCLIIKVGEGFCRD